MKNGMDLEAALIRQGLPPDVGPDTRPWDEWLLVCQRVSQSENGLARWEVVSAREDLVRQAKRDVAECVRPCSAGEEYRG